METSLPAGSIQSIAIQDREFGGKSRKSKPVLQYSLYADLGFHYKYIPFQFFLIIVQYHSPRLLEEEYRYRPASRVSQFLSLLKWT